MTGRTEILPKQTGETRTQSFDFTADLAALETISSQSCTAIVFSGTDPTPNTIISGGSTATGAVVSQKLTGGILGTLYTITCTIITSNSNTLKKVGLLAIVTAL